MTFRKYLPVISIHPSIFLFILIAFLTGMLTELVIILSIVLWHEFGHFIGAKRFKWRINSIMLWIFGGVMTTDEYGTRPLYEEAIVTIAGPFQHLIIYLVIYLFSTLSFFSPSLINTMIFLNTTILLFNLLPIWPLDGGKLLFICLCSFQPFRVAYQWLIIISIISSLASLIIQMIYFPFTFSAFFIMIFIMIDNWREWKQRHFVFMRFLLHRLMNEFSQKKSENIYVTPDSRLMDILSLFMMDCTHTIYVIFSDKHQKVIEERECLYQFFYNNRTFDPIGQIAS